MILQDKLSATAFKVNLEQAARLFDLSLEIEKDNAFALRGYAEILRLLGKDEEALVKFQESLELEPQNAFALRGFADILRQQGKFKEAALKYEEALAIEPKDKLALRGYAETLKAALTSSGRISAGQKGSDGVVCDEVIAKAIPEEQNGPIDPPPSDRKPAKEVDEAQDNEANNSINCYAEILQLQGKLKDFANKLQQRLTKEPENTKDLD